MMCWDVCVAFCVNECVMGMKCYKYVFEEVCVMCEIVNVLFVFVRVIMFLIKILLILLLLLTLQLLLLLPSLPLLLHRPLIFLLH